MTVSKKSKYKRFLFCCLRSNLLLFQFWESRHLLDAFPNDYESSKSHSLLKDSFSFYLQKENTIYLLKGNSFAVNHCKQKCSFYGLQQTVIFLLEDSLNYCSPNSPCWCSFHFSELCLFLFVLDSKSPVVASAQGKCWGSKAEQTINYCCK